MGSTTPMFGSLAGSRGMEPGGGYVSLTMGGSPGFLAALLPSCCLAGMAVLVHKVVPAFLQH